MPLNYTQLDGLVMAYYTAGTPDLPPLVLIHGYTSAYQVWRYVLPILQEHYYCIAVDLIGHGNSDKPDSQTPYQIAEQAERIRLLLEQLQVTQFALMGHSMGGQIALYIAAHWGRERVTTLLDVAGVVTPRLDPELERVFPSRIRDGKRYALLLPLLRPFMRGNRRVAKFYYGSWFYEWESVPFEMWRIDRDMATQPRMNLTLYYAWEAIHGYNAQPDLAQITAKTWVIFGEMDAVVPVEDGFLVKQHVKGAELVLYEGCGHFPMYEKRDAFHATLLNILGLGKSSDN